MILGIDCAGASGSVALGDGQTIAYAAFLNTGKTHSERLLPMVDAGLKAVGMRAKDLQAVAVTQGPGSFTGLRIGMSTAKGLAQGAKIPFLALPTLEVLAQNGRFFTGLVCPILNARREEVYTGLFQAGGGQVTRLTPDKALSLSVLFDRLPDSESVFFCGDGLDAYEDLIRTALGDRAFIPCGPDRYLQASALVTLGAHKLQDQGPDDLIRTQPVYLRQSEAVIRWQAQNPGKSLED